MSVGKVTSHVPDEEFLRTLVPVPVDAKALVGARGLIDFQVRFHRDDYSVNASLVMPLGFARVRRWIIRRVFVSSGTEKVPES